MASPQTERGFVMIALDLFAAILAADLPNRCMVVLSEVLLQSYGPQKRRNVHLDPPTIEHYSGLHRNNVHKAIRELKAAGMLGVNADGSFRFVKDYDSWTPHGEPIGERLGGAIRKYIEAANGRFAAVKASAKAPIQPDIASTSDPIQGDSLLQSSHNPTGLPFTDVTQSNGIVAYRGSRASEELEIRDRENKDHTYTACAGAQPLRTPEDFEDVRLAARVLSGDLRTQHLAGRLLQEHNTAGLIAIAGWQWLIAANKQVGPNPTHSQRKNWGYFVATARNTGEDERDAGQVAPCADSGTVRLSRAEAQRQKRKQDAARKHAEEQEKLRAR